jgi:membrane-associated phospholipid phosphatase
MNDQEQPSDHVPELPAGREEPPTIGATMVDSLEHGRHPSPFLVRLARELDVLDRAVYAAVAGTPTPTIDDGLRRLSNAADGGRLWLGVAAAMSVFGGRRGRLAALHGATALGLAAAAVHVGIKPVVDRARPERAHGPSPRHVLMPTSTSFPSGHAASGIAFANAVAADVPLLALPLRLLATATAYSRVHGGVHYPGDVIVGAVVGAVTGDLVRSTASRRARKRGARRRTR